MNPIHQHIANSLFDMLVRDIREHFVNKDEGCEFCRHATDEQQADTAYNRTVEAVRAFHALEKFDAENK